MRHTLQNRKQWLRLAFSSFGLLFSTGLSALFFAYIFYLSYQMPTPEGEIEPFNQLPAIESTAHDGTPFNTTDLVGKNFVIVFYRGHW